MTLHAYFDAMAERLYGPEATYAWVIARRLAAACDPNNPWVDLSQWDNGRVWGVPC